MNLMLGFFELLNSDPCRPSYGLSTLNSHMGEGSAHRGRQTEVSKPHAAEVSRPHAKEVSIPHPVEVSRARLVELSRARHVELSSSCRAQLVL